MNQQIKSIWIESEAKGPIIGGEIHTNDNSDVIVTLVNGVRYVATFFTYENINFLTEKNKQTGENLRGKYFWASNMILIDSIDRTSIEQVVSSLVASGEFVSSFKPIGVPNEDTEL